MGQGPLKMSEIDAIAFRDMRRQADRRRHARAAEAARREADRTAAWQAEVDSVMGFITRIAAGRALERMAES